MKRIPALLLLLVVAQSLTGCFSTAYRMNSGMSAGSGGGNASGAVAAGALDVVTLPLQAPVIVGLVASHPNLLSKDSKAKTVSSPAQKEAPPLQQAEPHVDETNPIAKIYKDPEYLFTHRDSLSRETVRLAILHRNIPFTEDQLRRLGGTNEWTRTYVAANWLCPQDLLEDIWRGLPALPDSERPIVAEHLVENPKIPRAWLEEIARRQDLYKSASDKAARFLRFKNLQESPAFKSKSPPTLAPLPPGSK